MKTDKIYNYLLTNGVPFFVEIYPKGEYVFHIKINNHYIMTSDLDRIEKYIVDSCLLEPDIENNNRLRKKYYGQIVHTDYA